MSTVTIEDAQARLLELIEKLKFGNSVVITRGMQAVAVLVPVQEEKPEPRFGRCKGMMTIVSDDDEHLRDFAEYMS
jgi:antitoxin (DNA-binding transcriptional repressor) of toxin-antitoxin stability system